MIACALFAAFLVDRLARMAWRAPLATRLAVRDLARYRSRSGAAMAAVSFAVFLAVIGTVIASVRYDEALDYVAPNMAASQLILYAPGNDGSQQPTGQSTPAARLAATRQQADALARELHAPAPLELDVPVIEEAGEVPGGTSVPNTTITESAVKALHETIVPVGWLVQAPTALTAVQINTARQAALTLGTTVETKSGQLSLDEISTGATVGGLLLALGVLAMTVGLIRSETAGDLRTLTAAGATTRTRRALTAVTAGVLALLGAGLGTVAGFLASLSWAHSSIITTFGNVPWPNIGLLLIGMPLIAAAGGWLLGGRRPAGLSRQPLD